MTPDPFYPFLVLGAGCLAALSRNATALPPSYRIEPIGAASVRPLQSYLPIGIDNTGAAVINFTDEDSATPASLRWDGNRFTNFLPANWTAGRVAPNGLVACQSYDPNNYNTPIQSAIWAPDGSFRILLPPPGTPPNESVFVQSVNSRGAAIGLLSDQRLVQWDPDGTPHNLGIQPTGYTIPYLSETGAAYGFTAIIEPSAGAFAAKGFVGLGDDQQLIAYPGYDATRLWDMNSSGTAIGFVNENNAPGGFGITYQDGEISLLPTRPDGSGVPIPRAINDDGWIVGVDGDASLWAPDDDLNYRLQDLLNEPDSQRYYVQQAWAINASGQILVTIEDDTPGPTFGLNYTAILTPTTIPDPASLPLAAAPLALLTRPRPRRRSRARR